MSLVHCSQSMKIAPPSFSAVFELNYESLVIKFVLVSFKQAPCSPVNWSQVEFKKWIVWKNMLFWDIESINWVDSVTREFMMSASEFTSSICGFIELTLLACNSLIVNLEFSIIISWFYIKPAIMLVISTIEFSSTLMIVYFSFILVNWIWTAENLEDFK